MVRSQPLSSAPVNPTRANATSSQFSISLDDPRCIDSPPSDTSDTQSLSILGRRFQALHTRRRDVRRSDHSRQVTQIRRPATRSGGGRSRSPRRSGSTQPARVRKSLVRRAPTRLRVRAGPRRVRESRSGDRPPQRSRKSLRRPRHPSRPPARHFRGRFRQSR